RYPCTPHFESTRLCEDENARRDRDGPAKKAAAAVLAYLQRPARDVWAEPVQADQSVLFEVQDCGVLPACGCDDKAVRNFEIGRSILADIRAAHRLNHPGASRHPSLERRGLFRPYS